MEAAAAVLFRTFLRAGVLFLITVCLVVGQIVPVHAQQAPPPPQRFVGQVVRLYPSVDNPTGFTLQLRNRTLDMTITSNTKFHADSAEAEVEGFQAGDYAVVLARRVNRAWVSLSIDFDVQPISVPQMQTVSGTILRVALNGKRFLILLDAGPTRWVTVTKKTRFHMDGQILDPPPPLLRGDMVQVAMERSNRLWIALDITIRTAGTPFYG
jgi:hypothetical protein